MPEKKTIVEHYDTPVSIDCIVKYPRCVKRIKCQIKRNLKNAEHTLLPLEVKFYDIHVRGGAG